MGFFVFDTAARMCERTHDFCVNLVLQIPTMKYILLLMLGLLFSCNKTESTSSNSKLERLVDSLVRKDIDSVRVAGIAIGVFKGKDKLLLKSYGFADLEHYVKLPVDASFEIGSVTKQFTAVATLLLAEQGKLSLDDDISKYIKFDTKGRKIAIKQLLNHTSGIRGYTEMPMFEKLMKEKHKRDTLLRILEKEPFDFEPGEALIYNNSAFFIMGLIIEKVSGMSYEEFVSKNLFEKAGMTHSFYCNERKVTKNRAHGYDMENKELVRAGYLDHTWPFAAGSLCSTVEDLVKWDDALHHGKILTEGMYQEFLTPAVINDGTVATYAKGITVREKNGRKMIEHGGGINGFLSENRYFPDDDLKIVVLVNSTGPVSPDEIADFITSQFYPAQKPVFAKYDGDVSKFLGAYKGRARGWNATATVTKNDTTIVLQWNDKATPLSYLKGNVWMNGSTKYEFAGSGDAIDRLKLIQDGYGLYILKKEK
jgi:CubicO group peptidase (beta-lactamase class C family)